MGRNKKIDALIVVDLMGFGEGDTRTCEAEKENRDAGDDGKGKRISNR